MIFYDVDANCKDAAQGLRVGIDPNLHPRRRLMSDMFPGT